MGSDFDLDQYPMDLLLKRRILPRSKQAVIQRLQDGTTEYYCVDCSAKFTVKDVLEQHLVTEHNNEFRHICGICGTGLKRREHLDRHVFEHEEKRPHVCPDCGKGFKRKEHLNIHKSIHGGDKNQKCYLCEKSFYRKDHLQKHLQTHGKEIMELQHNGFFIKQEIEECQQINSDGDEVSQMQSLDITESQMAVEKPFECEVCGKRYKRRDHLKIHSWTHREKDKICSQCGKAFHKDSQLLVHMSTHLNGSVEKARTQPVSEERPHECSMCARRFKRRAHLRVHMETHFRATVPPREHTIWCSRCNAGFTTNAEFELHDCIDIKQEQQLDISIEDDTATVATQENSKKENYPIEMVTASLSPPSPPAAPRYIADPERLPVPQRVYVCKFCGKPFKRKDHYKIHLHVHTGIKDFFCPDCGKGFYRKDHLQKHALVHSKPAKINMKKLKRAMPELFPISMMTNRKQEVKPEITITAPSNASLRMPLQIKVPYQVVMCSDDGEQRIVTVDPQRSNDDHHS